MTKHDYPVKVTVLRTEGSYSRDWLPSNLIDAITFLQEKLEEVPFNWRQKAEIEFDSWTEYDSSSMSMEIYYDRPATEEEIEARKQEEVNRLRLHAERTRQQLEAINKQLKGE